MEVSPPHEVTPTLPIFHRARMPFVDWSFTLSFLNPSGALNSEGGKVTAVSSELASIVFFSFLLFCIFQMGQHSFYR